MRAVFLLTSLMAGLTLTAQSYASEDEPEDAKGPSWTKRVQCVNSEGELRSFINSCPDGWVLTNKER